MEYQKIVKFLGKMDEWKGWKLRTEYAFDGSVCDIVVTIAIYYRQNIQMDRLVYSQLAVATIEGTVHHLVK